MLRRHALLLRSLGAFYDSRNVLGCDGFVHQQFFGSVADGWALGFGVDHDGISHIEVGGFIYEDVAISCSGFDYWDCRILQPRKRLALRRRGG